MGNLCACCKSAESCSLLPVREVVGGGNNGAVVAAGGDFDRPDNFEAMDDLVPSPGSVIDFVCEPEEVVPPLPPLDFVPGRRRVMGRGFFVDDGVPLRPPRSLSICVDEN